MNQKSKAIAWICLTVLTATGLKYLPAYLVEEQKLEQADRALDLKEESLLQRRPTPTVSVPGPIQPMHGQWL